MEIWKEINGFENYQISNLGNLKSIKNNKEYYMALPINQDGYYQVALYKNGEQHNKLVHRLVAEAFIENTYNKKTVNHKNGIKTDNRVDNLEWATNKEQTQHSINVLNHKSIITDKCRKKQIALHQRKVKRSDGITFNSIKEASNGNDSLRRKISSCCRNKLKTAGGYKWEYI